MIPHCQPDCILNPVPNTTHKSQIFFWLLISFLTGTGFASFFSAPIIFWNILIGFALVSAIFFWPIKGDSRFSRFKYRNWKYVFFSFFIILFAFGGLRMQAHKTNASILSEFADKNISIALVGYIDSEVENLGTRQRFVLAAREIHVPGAKGSVGEKVLITTQRYPEYFYGNQVAVAGKLKTPQNFSDFDYVTYLAKDQIFTLIDFAEIDASKINLTLAERIKITIFKNIFVVKRNFQESIQRSIAEPNASYLNAILTGARKDIPQDLRDDFAKTGTSHILAISGYHVSAVALAISWLFLLFFKRKLAFWLSVFSILIYAILTGAAPSVIRATVMGLLVLLAYNSGRLYESKNALALAAALMVWFNPMIMRFDVAFQLSFLATIGILYVAPLVEPYSKKLPNLFNFRETFIRTTSAQIMVLPLIIFYFHNLSLVSLPANLLVLPLVPYAMFLGFLTGIAGMLWGGLGIFIGYFAWVVTYFEILIIRVFSSMPFSSLDFSISWPFIIAIYLALFYILYKFKVRLNMENKEGEDGPKH